MYLFDALCKSVHIHVSGISVSPCACSDRLSWRQEERTSFKERLHNIQELCLQVQIAMDSVASFCERIKK